MKTNAEIIQELVDAERLKVAAMTDEERFAYYDELTVRQRKGMSPYKPGPRQAQAEMPQTIHKLPQERLAGYTDDQLLEELKRRKIVQTVECQSKDLIEDPDSERGIAQMSYIIRSNYRALADAIAHRQINEGAVPRGGAVFKERAGLRVTEVSVRAVLHVLY